MEKWKKFLIFSSLVVESSIDMSKANIACNCVDNSESDMSISQIQTVLYNNGYKKYLEKITFASGTADGICGEETRSAIMAFQTDHNLQIDACVGNETEGKMKELGLLKSSELPTDSPRPTYKKISIKITKNNTSTSKDFEPDQIIAYLVRGNKRKPVTMNDALWFAKMIHGETYGNVKNEDAVYMVWSLINRLGRGWWSMKLSKYIQYYSQPISPAWLDGGSRCSAAKQKRLNAKEKESKAKNPKKWFYNPCSKKTLKYRARFRGLTERTVNPLALDIVLQIFQGKIKPPPEPVSGWFANFMFNKNANSSGIWHGGEGKGSVLKKVAEVRKNSYYQRIDHHAQKVIIEPVNQGEL